MPLPCLDDDDLFTHIFIPAGVRLFLFLFYQFVRVRSIGGTAVFVTIRGAIIAVAVLHLDVVRVVVFDAAAIIVVGVITVILTEKLLDWLEVMPQ